MIGRMVRAIGAYDSHRQASHCSHSLTRHSLTHRRRHSPSRNHSLPHSSQRPSLSELFSPPAVERVVACLHFHADGHAGEAEGFAQAVDEIAAVIAGEFAGLA